MAIIGFSLMAMVIFFLDLLIKDHIERSRKEGEETAVCGGRLLLRRYHNKGAMLDAGERRSDLVAALSVAGLALLLGGAYSNTYDRLVRKYVVDYVSFPVKNEKIRNVVFNISDFCIMIGALLMVLGSGEK